MPFYFFLEKLKMYLQRIEISGFKSFANKTTLEFTPQTSAIVGPNGSGKSNIVDAIRWVTGEQSLKNLRGKKSQDVIFSGSKNKARSSLAEVSLYLNNDDKRVDIEYSTIIITRRLYRSGESEYLINKNKVRLQDIILLLAKANFGQKSYGIVSQGMTDYILTCDANDRKDFFDEAAGVKHHQIKRYQAKNKLARSQDNLEQGQLTLQEIEPRLKLLQRQVNKLNKRKKITQELSGLQQIYYSFLWQQIKNEKQKYQLSHDKKESAVKVLQEKISKLQDKLDRLAQEKDQQDVFNSLKAEFDKLNSDKNKLLKELSITKGKLNLEYVKAGKQNIAWLEDKKDELSEEITQLELDLSKIKQENDKLKQSEKETQNQTEILKNELELIKNNLESTEKELQGSNRNKTFVESSIEALLSKKDEIPGIYGTISQLGKVSKKNEVALAVAAGSRLKAIVVENQNTAIKCIQFLKQNRLASLTFIPLDKIKTYQNNSLNLDNKNIVGQALDLISFEPRLTKAFEFVFANTLIVNDEETAKGLGNSGRRIITLDGDVFEKSGVIRGGHRSKNFFRWNQNISSSQDKRITLQEISSLKDELQNKLKQYQELEDKKSQFQVDIRLTSEKEQSLQNKLTKTKQELNAIKQHIEENQLSDQNQDTHLKNIKEKSVKINSKVETINQQILTVQKDLNNFNLTQDSKKHELIKTQEEIRQTQKVLDIKNQDLNEVSIYLAKLDTRQDSLKREIKEDFSDTFEAAKDIDEDLDIQEAWKKIKSLRSALEAIGNIDPQIVEEFEVTKERFDFIQGQVIDLKETIISLNKLVADLDKIIKKEFNQAFNKINSYFSQYFKILFDGGNANLDLTTKKEGDEDEESQDGKKNRQKIIEGLEIVANPPGKKIKNIESLSGGEKSMTALALVCAVIAYNPPPFVILDEADAALDESNTQKFSKIIDKLSGKTQFIIVTHNRVTMEKANILYGITMNRNAISEILSISLEDAQETAAR